MENINTEKDKISSKINVLAIGDPEEYLEEYEDDKKRVSKFYRDSQADFRKHLGYLLLGTRNPIEFVDNCDLVELFGVSVHKKDNQTRSYYFHCTTGNFSTAGHLISGPTLSGRAVMAEVKGRLRGENWISENEISTPIKAKLPKEYFNCDQYIQSVVSDALRTTDQRLFSYVLHLHKEHRNVKKV